MMMMFQVFWLIAIACCIARAYVKFVEGLEGGAFYLILAFTLAGLYWGFFVW